VDQTRLLNPRLSKAFANDRDAALDKTILPAAADDTTARVRLSQ